MAPSYKSVVKKYKNDKTNCFFVCEMDEVIERTKPSLWIAGHMHSAIDYKLYKTRVIHNPRGYMLKMGLENPLFNPNLIIDTKKDL